MGRAKYTPEAINAIMASFVTATKNIIDSDGLESVSIRRISAETGYSSATLYLYFDDVSELLTMSLVSYLSNYVSAVIESTPENEPAEEAYRRTWVLFCEHAFSHPREFENLFFGPKSNTLDTIVKKYYELFPDELVNASEAMRNMLGRGNLFNRNRIVLASIAHGLGFSERETDIANDLTISYFHHFLDRAIETRPDKAARDELTGTFLEGAFFVLHRKL